MKKMTKEEAVAALAKHVKDAYASIEKAEKLADEHGLSFNFELAYGMGGCYSSEEAADGGEWHPSSQSC